MHCIIVRRGDFQTYDSLYQIFGSRLPVIWDRRERASPRHRADQPSPNATERRTPGPPASWVALGFVVVDRPER
jgi:hypothetical protein